MKRGSIFLVGFIVSSYVILILYPLLDLFFQLIYGKTLLLPNIRFNNLYSLLSNATVILGILLEAIVVIYGILIIRKSKNDKVFTAVLLSLGFLLIALLTLWGWFIYGVQGPWSGSF